MAKLEAVDIYHNQAAILGWLRGLGHRVDFGPDTNAEPLVPRPGFTPLTVRVLQSYNGRPCPFCGETMQQNSKHYPSRDHIHPRHAGGTFSDPNNCRVICGPCNNDKGGKNMDRFVWWLERRNDPRADRVKTFASGAYK